MTADGRWDLTRCWRVNPFVGTMALRSTQTLTENKYQGYLLGG